jgi:uncharacterized membrane protein YhaH (DUF805 family)
MNDLKKYFSFEGKSTRSEYWAINLCSYVILLFVGLITALVIMSGIFGAISGVLLILGTCVLLAWLVFSVTVRRCRDIGISPWFTLALLIPYIAIIPFIVFGCLKSEVKIEQSTN